VPAARGRAVVKDDAALRRKCGVDAEVLTLLPVQAPCRLTCSILWVLLCAGTVGRYFRRGQKDVFVLRSRDLGKLTMLQVWHNNKRTVHYNNNGGELRQCKPGWYLDRVVVEKVRDGVLLEATTFPCAAWLNEERWDKIEVRLQPSTHDGPRTARGQPAAPPLPEWWPGAPAAAVSDRDPRVDVVSSAVHTPTAGPPKPHRSICRGRAAQRGTYGPLGQILVYGIPRGSS
jgi:hypothetical protein